LTAAEAWWRRALHLDPSNQRAQECLRLIAGTKSQSTHAVQPRSPSGSNPLTSSSPQNTHVERPRPPSGSSLLTSASPSGASPPVAPRLDSFARAALSSGASVPASRPQSSPALRKPSGLTPPPENLEAQLFGDDSSALTQTNVSARPLDLRN